MPDAHLLRRSFQHLPGISASVEARLWAEGISDWTDLIRHTPVQLDLYRKRGGALQSAVEASEDALANSDIAYFANRLPKREFYRIAASFPERCVFLDIESTGLSTHYDQVTLVGWSVGSTYTVLVDPNQIGQLERDLREHPMIVTFNGSLFDLPFLAKRFKTDWSGHFHVDLRYLAKRVGLTGGQKKIEVEIGLTREGSLEGITGAEAVALWFDYKEGDLNALRELVRYKPRGYRRNEVPVRGSNPPDCPAGRCAHHEWRSLPAIEHLFPGHTPRQRRECRSDQSLQRRRRAKANLVGPVQRRRTVGRHHRRRDRSDR